LKQNRLLKFSFSQLLVHLARLESGSDHFKATSVDGFRFRFRWKTKNRRFENFRSRNRL